LSELKIAVVTENHPIDMFAFTDMLEALPNVRYYMQSIDLLANDKKNIGAYDAFLFYHLNTKPPENEQVQWLVKEYLGSTTQGIVLLHHAICCYRGMEEWTRMTGIADRTFKYHWDQNVECKVVDPEHPITRGMNDFSMIDETYTMDDPVDEGTTRLVTIDHPLSMKTLAWTREYGKSRVLNYVSGHDHEAYQDESFLGILGRGVQWVTAAS